MREATTKCECIATTQELTIQMWVLGICNEELASICVRATVGHRDDATGGMLEVVPKLVGKLLAPYAGSSLQRGRVILCQAMRKDMSWGATCLSRASWVTALR